MGRKKHHNIYVIELDRSVLKERKFLDANPGHDPEKECYYIGMTGLPPDERFENHKSGYKSNRFVKKYGLKLCPRWYDEHNPLSYKDAVEMEAELARILRSRGHAVWQK